MVDRGCVIWFTGLSGAGKSTIAASLQHELLRLGHRVEVLDGDIVRANLSRGLSFSKEDRDVNVMRIGFVAHLLARNGVKVICAAISPYRNVRDRVRAMTGDFVEVYIATSLEECEMRDVKGLYKKARSGEIKDFTGVDDPYEPPLKPEVHIDTVGSSPEEAAYAILDEMQTRGYL